LNYTKEKNVLLAGAQLINRFSDSSGTREAYTYLGVGTVVVRSQPEAGVSLTYVTQTGEANGDAGDQYTGLDRFGRVVDQRWLKTSTGVATDETRGRKGRKGDATRITRTLQFALFESRPLFLFSARPFSGHAIDQMQARHPAVSC
jgi:hypothetical protein